jgi:hypothetical protein
MALNVTSIGAIRDVERPLMTRTSLTTLAVARDDGNADSASDQPGYRGPFDDSHDRFHHAARFVNQRDRPWFEPFVQPQQLTCSVKSLDEWPLAGCRPWVHEAQWHVRGAVSSVWPRSLEIQQLV